VFNSQDQVKHIKIKEDLSHESQKAGKKIGDTQNHRGKLE
jgi:hypothetical protein